MLQFSVQKTWQAADLLAYFIRHGIVQHFIKVATTAVCAVGRVHGLRDIFERKPQSKAGVGYRAHGVDDASCSRIRSVAHLAHTQKSRKSTGLRRVLGALVWDSGTKAGFDHC